ncbi:2,3-bisphosphoglycerate-independent phosphoglycerate mutase [Tanacetum coccineum]
MEGSNTLHLIGLIVMVVFTHLLLNGASERGAKKIRVHMHTDGRDVLDGSSVGLLKHLKQNLHVYAARVLMHMLLIVEDNDWEVVKRGWDAEVLREAPHKFKSAVEAIKTLRQALGANDQYLPPFVIVDDSDNPT